MDCIYLALFSVSQFSVLHCIERALSVSHVVFPLTAMTARFGSFDITHMTSMLMEELLLYLLVTNVITLGRLKNQKC